jgi:protein-tyrosine phosphatase
MFSKLFGSKRNTATESSKAPANANWSFLKTDIHSHMIPGIDDGAPTMEESLEMIREFRNLGYENIITTPHIKYDHYPNTAAIIKHGLKELQQAVYDSGIRMNIRAAAEYYLDDHFMELLERKELLPIHKNEVLIEFSFSSAPVMLPETIFRIQTQGYKPIIAHPERYTFYHQNQDIFQELKDRGCLLQLNATSLTGYYGKGSKDVAERLLKQGLYDYCGSDMHNMRHCENMRQIMTSKAFSLLYNYPFKNAAIVL